MFAFICKVFPVDRQIVGFGSLFLLLMCAIVGGALGRKDSNWIPFGAGIILVVFLSASPFWALEIDEKSEAAVAAAPVFSFSEAKANPAAFASWWKFFVDEVVRTNKIIFKRDTRGWADDQGIFPYVPIPGASTDFYQGKISINSQGYRGEEFSHEKGDIFRIITVGDSVTFGQTLFRDSRPWSAVLGDLIKKLQCQRPVEVINGGVNGHHLRNGIDRIEHDFSRLKPDMVLTYFGWNSMADMGIYPDAVAPLTAPPSNAGKIESVIWYFKKAMTSFFNELLTSIMRITSFGDERLSNADLMNSAKKGRLYQHYQDLIEQSRRLKYRLVLMSFNTAVTPDSPEAAKVFYEGPWPAVRTIIKQVEIHNLMIKELAYKEGVDYVDTGENLYGKYNEGMFLDVVHFTTKGDTIMAANVFHGIRPLLLKEKSLGCRPVF